MCKQLDPALVDSFIDKVEDYLESGLRVGQSAFNALYHVDPMLADLINGTENDPFYNDVKTYLFLCEILLPEDVQKVSDVLKNFQYKTK